MNEPKKISLTAPAIERLKEELERLQGPVRRRIVDSISTARAHGDLSENAEYHAAREEQGHNEARIREIRHTLEHAELVESKDDGVAGPGKLVTIRYEGDDPETYLLGRREEKGGDHEILTPDSPVGSLLVGKSAGEEVVATVNDRELRVRILEVRPAG